MSKIPRNGMRAIHPGEILREEYVELGLSANQLAKQLGIPTNRLTEILAERRGITADTALRLEVVLGTSPDFWMNLQAQFELQTTEKKIEAKLKKLKRLPERK